MKNAKALGMKKANAGFTLVEIILVLVLIGIVMNVAALFLDFSYKAEQITSDEYDIQSEVRLATEILNNAIRNSSVTFTLAEDVFIQPKKDKWNYFGLENTNEIVQYTWNATDSTHERKVLVKAKAGTSYNLYFQQNQPGTKLLEYHLEVLREGDDTKSISIGSELAALNSVTVDDGGSAGNPAVAVAYRSDPAPKPEEITTQEDVTIAIALVLDDSGSMDFDMQGRAPTSWSFDSSQVRKDIMKTEAKKLIDQFAALENIKVSVIPFATTANNPGNMLDATASKTALKTRITNLDAYGGTNTGDGFRRAYHKLRAYNNDHPGDEIVNYIILLTDGDPTFRSSTRTNTYIANLNDGDISDSYVFGNGNNDGWDGPDNLARSMAYVDAVGTMIVNDGNLNIGTFVIGFSAVPGDIANNQTIAEDYCDGTYYTAGSAIELEDAFNEITQTILQETWHIYGPY